MSGTKSKKYASLNVCELIRVENIMQYVSLHFYSELMD